MNIYLDQNKWVDIARAYHGREDGNQYENVKNLILKNSHSDKWKFPVSVVHLLETFSRKEADSRIKLSEVITKVSSRLSILPYFDIEEDELCNAFKKLIGQTPESLKEKVIRNDIFTSVGLSFEDLVVKAEDTEVKQHIENYIHSNPDILFNLFSLGRNINEIDEDRKEDEMLALNLEADRKNLEKVPEQYRLKLLRWRYFEFRFLPMIPSIENKLQISREKTKSLLANGGINDLYENIPTFDVRSKLNYSRFKENSKPVDRNDVKDLAFLSMALPYCDVIVTEKSWAHYIRLNQLDKKYNTKVFTNVNELMTLDNVA